MKIRVLLIITICILSVKSYSQKIENKDYSEELLKSEFIHDRLDKSQNVLIEFKNKDLSTIWKFTPEQDFNGILGIEHQRIRIYFSDVEKKNESGYIYDIKGKSLVKSNVCDFVGEIVFNQIYKLKFQDFESEGITEYVAIGDYKFVENVNQYGAGVFKGKFAVMIFIDDRDKKTVYYDDIKFTASAYTNNYFIGTWKSSNTSKIKICNWGDSRIPFTNRDFDVGEGEMYISEKYYKYGWESYMKYYFNKTPELKKIEKGEWWK